MSDHKDDKDLRISGEMKFQITFLEDEKGQMRYDVKAQSNAANMMTAYALVATRIQAVIDNNEKETDKKLRLTANDKRTHCAIRDYCSRIAGALSNQVYAEGMKQKDARIVIPEKKIEIVKR